ncbi:histone-lysine N-methyltransferase [candidate division WOR-1 bacterium RIFCSPHIGHO2_01_FULL_53_15]|uniref:Histone-lysine N-methyltransferase n=1 Tax=candidate division WOR-1 bacterium RIFCSPHIGHO2_01_FULL_53_15 TaxID=1802564 RepID=A0A1F4Q3E1_UNCSA|nr:MAG: histone-lysine N-methyltransferase [candidate division WOR-1 bacterium RIFCSPHIGHO2_01_FULL_53_15]OGC12716.1 MAG: histone-lysine N-methyltransferase [candidate division WOR-1 bacterium RIFCSPHIGHO2_02_FULL_53_26]
MLNEKDLVKETNETPNLLRGLFPYEAVPKIAFDYQDVPLNPPDDIWITCTTFRDGQQARPPYSVKQIVDLFTFLHRLGGPKGIIRQSEFFLYSEKDREAVRKCQELGFQFPEITGWIRAVKNDFKLVKEMGLKETGILTSASDYHIFLKLGLDRKKAMESYLDIVKAALEIGVIPRCHLEDITRADFYGFILPFVQQLMALSKEAKIPIKVRACDTMGYGVPYAGAALPRSVGKLIYKLVKEGGVPPAQLEWHGHNDFHKVLINASTAWLYGCSAANGTLLGFGERTGNPPIEGLIIEYIGLMGKTNGIDTAVITEIAEYFKNEIGHVIPPNYPFVGSEFNTTAAGIHADGLIKNPEIYNIFDTGKILKRPMGITITDKSGAAGIAFWLNSHFGLTGEQMIPKNHPAVLKINDWVASQYSENRTTTISTGEMIEQVKLYLPEYIESDFAKLKKKTELEAKHLIEDLVAKKEIKSMVPALQEPALEEFLKKNAFIQFIYVVGQNGLKATKNIVHPQDAELFNKLSPDENYSDRPWFKGAVEAGGAFVTDFYTSKLTNKLCITVAAPIKGKGGKIMGILGADIKFEDIAKL